MFRHPAYAGGCLLNVFFYFAPVCPHVFQLGAIKRVNARYTSLAKQDIEALESTFPGTKFD